MSKTAPYSIRFDPELRADLERLAEQDGRSLANYIEWALKKHVARETKAVEVIDTSYMKPGKKGAR